MLTEVDEHAGKLDQPEFNVSGTGKDGDKKNISHENRHLLELPD